MEFELHREYFDTEGHNLEHETSLSTQEMEDELDQAVENERAVGFALGPRNSKDTLSFEYNPDNDWRVLVTIDGEDEYDCSGLPTEKVKKILKRYAQDGEWSEVLEKWEGQDEDEILNEIKEWIEPTPWKLNEEFDNDSVEMLSKETGSQFIFKPQNAYSIGVDEHLYLHSRNFRVTMTEEGSIAFAEE